METYYIDREKSKNRDDHCNRHRKSIWQNPIPYGDKWLNELGIEKNSPNLIKDFCDSYKLLSYLMLKY